VGMFDYLKSSYDLGPTFTNVELHTKNIEEDYGGTMSHFYIDPAGYLWVGSYAGTSTLEIYEEGDPRYNPKFKWANHEWIPTGEHGKWRVFPLTKYVEVYPSQWDGAWGNWPRLRLHFKSGKLQDWEDVTGR
jgi:hypothetical protein